MKIIITLFIQIYIFILATVFSERPLIDIFRMRKMYLRSALCSNKTLSLRLFL